MTHRKAMIAAVIAGCAAGPGFAQAPPPADPIDAILRGPAKPPDPEEPDTAATGSSAVEPDPVLPATPQAYVPRPALTEPVFLHETGKAPDAPPTPAEQAYDSRLRSSAAVRGVEGPMEGGWTLSAGGRDLYVFQLVDRDGYVDGAWRDPRRPGRPDSSGFIDEIQRSGGELTFRFAAGVVAVLRGAGGRWTGQLTEAGQTERVTLARRGG